MDRAILELVRTEHRIPVARDGGDGSDLYPFYLLVETQGSCGEHDKKKMTMFLEKAMDSGE
jgi:hypothetical protein